jgi:spermidine/putrescine-binding protein
MVIPKAAPHKFTAEVFINYMLRPEVAADNANTTGYATANQVAMARYVTPQVRQNPAIYPPEALMQRLTFLDVIPDTLLPVYDEIWLRVLAG